MVTCSGSRIRDQGPGSCGSAELQGSAAHGLQGALWVFGVGRNRTLVPPGQNGSEGL